MDRQPTTGTHKRILAIGDIHGCSRAFDRLLEAVNLQASDRVISLGDYVDRGPDSSGVIERILALRKTYSWIALRGNHEQMMLDARFGRVGENIWLACGGRATLTSYSVEDQGNLLDFGQSGLFSKVPASHWEFLEHDCVDWYETENHFFVHAGAFANLSLDDQPRDVLHYEKFVDPAPHTSGKIMVCGHTAQKSGTPNNLGHAICIDTWVYGEGWLTCLDVISGRVWQANQQGDQRQAWIDDFLTTPEL